jgi:hypothetical protein
MAGFSRVNGDLKGVAVFDVPTYNNTGVNTVETGVTVQPQGPKLEYFTVTATGALNGAQVNTVIQTVTQLATIHMYEYTDAANDTVAMAIYPVAAWTAGAIDAALVAAGLAGTTTTASATFTG